MKSLATRHEDRAKRKAENALGSEDVTTESLAFVESQMRTATDAFNRLSDEQKDEVRASLEAGGGDTNRSLAEDETGNHTLAGIGVVNTKVVPATVLANENSGEGGAGATGAAAAKDAGWGATPPPSIKTPEPAEPIEGNLSGAALQAQGAGSDETASSEAQGGNGGGTGSEAE